MGSEGRFGPSCLGVFLVLTRVKIEELSLGTLLTRLVRECVSVFMPRYACAYAGVNALLSRSVAFSLETVRNCTAPE